MHPGLMNANLNRSLLTAQSENSTAALSALKFQGAYFFFNITFEISIVMMQDMKSEEIIKVDCPAFN